MGEFVKVASIDEIPKGKMKSVTVGHDRLVVCHDGDGYYAFADECSHDYAPISSGWLRGQEVVCPRHGAKFDIKTGEPTAPPAVAAIDTFKVKVEDGNIYVFIE